MDILPAESPGQETVLAMFNTIKERMDEVQRDQREERDARVVLTTRVDALEQRDNVIVDKLDKIAQDNASREGALKLSMWTASFLGPTGLLGVAATIYHLFTH
ncbi:hypothetical protein HK17_14260 [Acetobacter indonesiensis]|uniref:Uncharacterized protein n=1 Tax=Acetobacter indonesiensis TaxID=104101 RepID=A0A252AKD7_9PROT|nr:hypothetical protein HK17_14260 [Acetobacter indonesiensis]